MRPTKCPDIPVSLTRNTEVFPHHFLWAPSTLLIWTGGGRNINNFRYADDTTLMAENEEELKSLLMKVKEENEKAGLATEQQIALWGYLGGKTHFHCWRSCSSERLRDKFKVTQPGNGRCGIRMLFLLVVSPWHLVLNHSQEWDHVPAELCTQGWHLPKTPL